MVLNKIHIKALETMFEDNYELVNASDYNAFLKINIKCWYQFITLKYFTGHDNLLMLQAQNELIDFNIFKLIPSRNDIRILAPTAQYFELDEVKFIKKEILIRNIKEILIRNIIE